LRNIDKIKKFQKLFRSIEMEPLRTEVDSTPRNVVPIQEQQPIPVNPNPNPITNPNTVTYAQIMRPSPTPQYVNLSNELDFRLQAPQTAATLSQQTSGRSSISSGYIDLTSNLSRNHPHPPMSNSITNRRPQSPETSF
jgi:hypothetical protein